MITTITANRHRLIGRIALQIFLFVLLLYSIYRLSNAPNDTPQPAHILNWCLLCVLVFANVGYFGQLLFFPFGLIIDDKLMQLEIKYLILPSKTVSITDIASYSSVLLKSRSDAAWCILVKLSNGKNILIGDVTLNDSSALELFLRKENVPFLGEEKWSIYSYFVHQ